MGKILKCVVIGALIAFSYFVLWFIYQLCMHWGDIPWGEIVDTPHKKAQIFCKLAVSVIGFVGAGVFIRAFSKKAICRKKQNKKLLDLGVGIVEQSCIKAIGYFFLIYLLLVSSSLAEYFGCDIWIVEFFRLLANELILPIAVFVFAVAWYWDELIAQGASQLEHYLDDGLDARDAVNKINDGLGYRYYEVSHNKLTNMRKVIHHG